MKISLTILRQAWPVLVGQCATMAFCVLDTAMIGHTSTEDLAAIALGTSIYTTVFVGLMGIVHSLIPTMGNAFGSKKFEEIGFLYGQGIWLAILISLIGIGMLLFPNSWLILCGPIEHNVYEIVKSYLIATSLSLPAILIFRVIYCLGSAVCKPKPIMFLSLIGILFKAILNWALIYGEFGLYKMGAVGAGISTTITTWLTLLLSIFMIKSYKYFDVFKLHVAWPNWKVLKDLTLLGLPMGGSYLIEVCAFTFMGLIVAREGTLVTGAHQIISNITTFLYMMPVAFGISTATLVAQTIGASQSNKNDNNLSPREVGLCGFRLTILGAIITSFVVFILRQPILLLYTSENRVYSIASSMLPILPVFHIFDAMQCINIYLLRAHKITFIPLLIQILTLIGFGLFGGWWFAFNCVQSNAILSCVHDFLIPDSPHGIGFMWLMTCGGFILSSIILRSLYHYSVMLISDDTRN